MHRGIRKLHASGVVLIFVFLLAPILKLVIESFIYVDPSGNNQLTLRFYQELFSDKSTYTSLITSLQLALVSSVLSASLGVFLSWGLFRAVGQFKSIAQVVSRLPLVTPEIAIGLGLLLLFVRIDFSLGWSTVLIAHITFSMPFAIMISSALLDKKLLRYETAAKDLGATRSQRLFWVTLPQLAPAFLVSFVAGFILSLDDFTITFFNAGVEVVTLPLKIYSMTRVGVTPIINASCTLMILCTLLAVALTVQAFNRLKNQKSQ